MQPRDHGDPALIAMPVALFRHPNIAALVAGFLSATGFAPLDLWPVTLACLALLIALVQDAPDRRAAFARGWLFGVGHFVLGLNWIAHAFSFQDAMPHWFGYGAVILLSLYLAVYPAVATLAAWSLKSVIPAKAGTGPRTKDDIPFILLLAALWLATEYLRATLFTGFAWNPLGVVALPTGLAIASTLIGTYALGALVILAAGALLMLARRAYRPAAAIALPLTAIALTGLLTPAPPVPPGAPIVRVVQPNVDQGDKYSAALEQANFRKLATLTGPPRLAPRLIFWPEAAILAYLDMEPEWRDRLAALLGPGDLLLTGGDKVYFRETPKDYYTARELTGANNSLWILDARGNILGRYDKSHLVPYGEYLPMRQLLTPLGLSRLVPGTVDFWPGPGPRSLALPAAPGRPAMKMGVQICYEIIFSGRVVDAADRPAFLFNPSNDAWFGAWGPVQHLAQARLRAIEEGLPVIRATPTGISAVIDARGGVRSALGHRRAGYLETGLPPAFGPTIFARIGNWAALIVALALGMIAIAMRGGRG